MKTTLSLIAAAAVLSTASTSFAQTPAARPAGAAAPAAAPLPSRPGPNIPGVCVVASEGALTASSVGVAYRNRITALTQQVRAELQPLETAIQTEATALRTAGATLAGPARQTRETALNTRLQSYQTLAQQRTRELEATQSRQLQRLGAELRPVLDQVYGARGCGILIARDAVVAFNPAMDVTAQVTQGLNARIQTITFERERLPATPAAQ